MSPLRTQRRTSAPLRLRRPTHRQAISRRSQIRFLAVARSRPRSTLGLVASGPHLLSCQASTPHVGLTPLPLLHLIASPSQHLLSKMYFRFCHCSLDHASIYQPSSSHQHLTASSLCVLPVTLLTYFQHGRLGYYLGPHW
jgi:hypothetical protein